MDQRPSVFPTQQQTIDAANAAAIAKKEAFEREKLQAANEIYTNSASPSDTPYGHVDAVEMMRQRSQNELSIRKAGGVVQYPELAEKPAVTSIRVVQDQAVTRNEEQMRLRDEQLRINKEQILKYQQLANAGQARNNGGGPYEELYPQNIMGSQQQQQQQQPPQQQQPAYVPPAYVPPTPPNNPPTNLGYGENYGRNPTNIDPFIIELSQPNYNSPFDAIPLPSEGRLNRGVKSSVKIGYMTTADENILTSPNLLESGRFLEILINRKLLEPGLRYKDLHQGDRNALMIWLRATGYGEMYPVTLFDENDVPFDTEVNLNDLKTKKLGAEPDADGLFLFQFPLCRAQVKFKFLNCGDVDDIEKLVDQDKLNGSPINNSNVYTMQRMIVEVNGDRNHDTVKAFSNSIRIGDAKKFNEYVDLIESGIDLNIEVRTPGGGSVKTFLPLNINFFWPNIQL